MKREMPFLVINGTSINVINARISHISRINKVRMRENFFAFFCIYHNFLHLSFYTRNILAIRKMREMRFARNEKCKKYCEMRNYISCD